ncbi:MAG TPA: DUF4126 domain-containing protein [Candidatus Methylacidiphilales bacterium]
MNEPIAAVIVGLLLSVAAGVRIMLPLLAVNLLAFYHVILLPDNMAWLGSEPTLIILTVAAVTETVIHFIPAAGTGLKAMATPLAFVAGTLLMAVPLADKNPIYQWTLATIVGGGVATLAHLGVTGLRAMTEPANLASFGIFGVVWNIGELLISIVLTLLGGLCVVAGWVVGMVILFALLTFVLISLTHFLKRWSHPQPVAASI